MSEITHVKVFYCDKCEEIDVEYPTQIVDKCMDCNKKMEQIGWVEYEEWNPGENK